ncbi:glutamine amidotransferase [Hartmannibacter diazotrophicus]|uniref:Glutamine amidotransferase n=1 Tax=Hartmannibacter diazotrophicus TaxID=1482074 RepID=A0A2C9DAQ9_9HYPH|nr:glutamine amidotransferase [Hartmannibacter diazotrophicus]
MLHQETSSPGRIGQLLEKRGYALDIRRPRFGDPLPGTMRGHAGAIIFGGPMSANDPDPGIVRETDWIRVPLKEEAPFLGICLGAQMLARQLGAHVAPHVDGMTEIGYYRIRPTEAGREMMEWPGFVYQWHREGFEMPSGGELLATGDSFRNQAFRYGKAAYGIQFHAELTYAMMNRWTVRGSSRMSMPGAQSRRDHFAGRAIHDAAVRTWLNRFLDLWLEGTVPPALSAADSELKR